MKPQKSFPPSATHGAVAFAGLAAFIGSTALVHANLLPLDTAQAALTIILCTAFVIFVTDGAGIKLGLWKRPGSAGSVRGKLNWRRSFCKLLGLLASLAFIGLLYWLFPEYHGSFYDNYYEMLGLVLPLWLLLALPYVAFMDRRMREPHDGYWHMGKLVTGQFGQVKAAVVTQHLLGWIIKGYFLPLMFVYFCGSLESYLRIPYNTITDFNSVYGFLYNYCYFVDVGLCSLGYLLALRVSDTHIRSAEPTMLGWVVALFCYQPFYSLFRNQYLSDNSNYSWTVWLEHSPVLYIAWGCAIMVLTAIYAWATVAFGARFSNLTHRGIITNGPYRFTKHPAYIAKNISWWMVAVPFIASGSAAESIRSCVMMLMLNGIYLMRAKTEEWHLSRDPDYVAYAESVRRHGIFRFLNRVPGFR